MAPSPHFPASTAGLDLLVNLDSVDACRQSLDDLDRIEGGHPLVVSALRDRALRAWLDLDAGGALAHAEGNVKRFGESFGRDLFRVWIDLDVESAVEAFALASPALVASAYTTFFTELAHHDAERVLDMLARPKWDLGSRRKHESNRMLRKAYAILAKQDPKSAMARFQLDKENQVFARGYGNPGFNAILKTWAKVDAEAAWDYLKTRDEPLALEHIASHLLLEHPEVAEQVEPDQIAGICDEFTERDLAGAMRFAESRPEGDQWRREIFAHAARLIATAEPERALQFYKEGEGASQDFLDDGIFRQAFITLNAQDPERALALLPDVPEKMRTFALGGILTHEFAADPERACARSREFLDNPETSNLVIPALTRALSWGHGSGNHDLSLVVETLPEIRPTVRGYVLEGWVRVAPEAAAAFIAEEAIRIDRSGEDFFEGNHQAGDTTADAISELAFSRPEFTSEWVSTLPAGDLRDRITEALASNWVRFDRNAAESWVQSMPEGPMKEKAAKMLKAPEKDKSDPFE